MLTLVIIVCLLAVPVVPAASGSAEPGERALPEPAALPPNPSLPDPLATMDGKRVTSRSQWEKERRPELKRLFQHYMYGYFPPPGKVDAKVELEDRGFWGGKATERLVTLHYGPSGTNPIHLLEIVPNRRSGPAPVFVGIGFCGIAAIVDDSRIPISDRWMYDGAGVVNHRATESSRGAAKDVWNAEMAIDRGYAVALFYNGDVEPDVAGTPDGIRARLHSRPGAHDWGTIAAWAWGVQRVVDYLETDRDIDHRKIAVVGHSRNGKASILAAAFDERISLAIPLQAGCGGTAPSRGKVGESVKQINTVFPHWFCDTFKEFNEHPERLPFDQNGLAALMAPRPVLFSNAVEDSWANPAGQFEVLRGADSVYKLLGVEGLGSSEMPPVGKLLDSRLGYFIRPGQHSMTRVDWEAFLSFTDRHFGKPH